MNLLRKTVLTSESAIRIYVVFPTMNNVVDLKLYLNNIPTKNNEMLKKHDVNQG